MCIIIKIKMANETVYVSSAMLIACFLAIGVICRGIRVSFSLTIVGLLILVNTGYIVSYLFTPPTSVGNLSVMIAFDFLIQFQVPINILFTERQWIALKRYSLSFTAAYERSGPI